jgi:hypothetical protein
VRQQLDEHRAEQRADCETRPVAKSSRHASASVAAAAIVAEDAAGDGRGDDVSERVTRSGQERGASDGPDRANG